MTAGKPSGTFSFLRGNHPQLAELAILAEQYVPSDPNTSMVKLRQFAESWVDAVLERNGTPREKNRSLAKKIEMCRKLVPPSLLGYLDRIRDRTNEAVHEHTGYGSSRRGCLVEAQAFLPLVLELARWLHETGGGDPAEVPSAPPATDRLEIDLEVPSVWFTQQGHLARFAGRRRELGKVYDWVRATSQGGFLLIRAGPGVGKSAFMARVAELGSADPPEQGLDRTWSCLLHHIRCHRSVERILQALAWQAGTALGEPTGLTRASSAAEAKDRLLGLSAALARRNGRCVIVIDGLDELTTGGPTIATPERAAKELVAGPLPPGVCVVVSAQPDAALLSGLRNNLFPLTEMTLGSLTTEEIPEFFDRWIDSAGRAWLESRGSWARVMHLTGGLPLILRRVAEQATAFSRLSLGEQPGDLSTWVARSVGEVHSDVWRQLGRDRERWEAVDLTLAQAVLSVIAVAQSSLTPDQLRDVLGHVGSRPSLPMLGRAIDRVSPYLAGTSGAECALYHDTFRGFVCEQALSGPEGVVFHRAMALAASLEEPRWREYALEFVPWHIVRWRDLAVEAGDHDAERAAVQQAAKMLCSYDFLAASAKRTDFRWYVRHLEALNGRDSLGEAAVTLREWTSFVEANAAALDAVPASLWQLSHEPQAPPVLTEAARLQPAPFANGFRCIQQHCVRPWAVDPRYVSGSRSFFEARVPQPGSFAWSDDGTVFGIAAGEVALWSRLDSWPRWPDVDLVAASIAISSQGQRPLALVAGCKHEWQPEDEDRTTAALVVVPLTERPEASDPVEAAHSSSVPWLFPQYACATAVVWDPARHSFIVGMGFHETWPQCSRGGAVLRVSTERREPIEVLADAVLPIRQMAISSDGRWLVAIGEDSGKSEATAWDLHRDRRFALGDAGMHHRQVVFVAADRFVTAGSDGYLRDWSLESRREVKRVWHGGHPYDLVLVGRQVVAATIFDGFVSSIRCWTADGEVVAPPHFDMEGLAAVAGGPELITMTWDDGLAWRVDPAGLVPSAASSLSATVLGVSDDLRFAVSSTGDDRCVMWAPDTGAVLAEHELAIENLVVTAFTAPDGQSVITYPRRGMPIFVRRVAAGGAPKQVNLPVAYRVTRVKEDSTGGGVLIALSVLNPGEPGPTGEEHWSVESWKWWSRWEGDARRRLVFLCRVRASGEGDGRSDERSVDPVGRLTDSDVIGLDVAPGGEVVALDATGQVFSFHPGAESRATVFLDPRAEQSTLRRSWRPRVKGGLRTAPDGLHTVAWLGKWVHVLRTNTLELAARYETAADIVDLVITPDCRFVFVQWEVGAGLYELLGGAWVGTLPLVRGARIGVRDEGRIATLSPAGDLRVYEIVPSGEMRRR